MDWSKYVTWPVVVLGGLLCGTTVALVLWGHADLKDVGTLATTVIAALVLAQLKVNRDQGTRIEENTNGHLKRRDEKIDELQKTVALLASKLPPDAPLPKALSDEDA